MRQNPMVQRSILSAQHMSILRDYDVFLGSHPKLVMAIKLKMKVMRRRQSVDLLKACCNTRGKKGV